MPVPINDQQFGELLAEMKQLKSTVSELSNNFQAMQASFSTLVKLEVQHANTERAVDRAFASIQARGAEIQALSTKVESINTQLPGLLELRRWVIGGLGVALTMLLISVLTLAINSSSQQRFMQELLTRSNNAPTATKPSANQP